MSVTGWSNDIYDYQDMSTWYHRYATDDESELTFDTSDDECELTIPKIPVNQQLTNEGQPKVDKRQVKPQRKTYVTRDERRQFMRWYMDSYGYNTSRISADKLSVEYKAKFNVYIPKISIHRWIHSKSDTNEYLEEYSSMYIIERVKQVHSDVGSH
mgnify:CR=1 FL=1